MATFKVILDTRRKLKNGTFPIIIRIYKGRGYDSLNLKLRVTEDQFDPTAQRVIKHPNKKEFNQKIIQTLIKLQETALRMELNESEEDAAIIKASIVEPKVRHDMISLATEIVSELEESKHYGNSLFHKSAISALKKYSESETIPFKKVTYEFLTKLERKMLGAGLTVNGIAMYMRTIRAIYNRAIKSKIIDRSNYPFESFKIKLERTTKRNISKADLKAVTSLNLEVDSPIWHARNYFILCFNLIGISFADLLTLKKTDVREGRVIYRRKKTHKLYSIKLTDKAKEIISIYSKSGSIYLLPGLHQDFIEGAAKERKRIVQVTKNTNKYLQRLGQELNIGQKLTTYVARHSWATIAKRMGYSKDMIAEALGHEFGNKVTAIYLDSFDQEVIDEMNKIVCDFN